MSDRRIEEIEMNAPTVGEDSFSESLCEIMSAIGGDCVVKPEYVTAAAIHELTKTLNEHIKEMFKTYYER